jgi:HTH-type transcriptional regulator / antitoxin HipB
MKLHDTQQIGVAIRARRKLAKLTQRELALSSGVGLRFLIELEKGKTTCQVGKVLTVLRTLGISLQLEIPDHFAPANLR